MSDETEEPRFGVQASIYSPVIWVGALKKVRSRQVLREQQDLTDTVLAAVAQYVLKHFSGGLSMTLPNLTRTGVRMTVRVKPLEPGEEP